MVSRIFTRHGCLSLLSNQRREHQNQRGEVGRKKLKKIALLILFVRVAATLVKVCGASVSLSFFSLALEKDYVNSSPKKLIVFHHLAHHFVFDSVIVAFHWHDVHSFTRARHKSCAENKTNERKEAK